MHVNLTVKAGPHEGTVFEFKERANFVVGRSERANFRLTVKDNSISRIHFMIEVNPPQCRLTDMESTNGTRVNGKKVAMADLKDGDLITAGKTKLLVSMVGADETLATRTETIVTKRTGEFDTSLECDPQVVPRTDPSEHAISSTDYSSRRLPRERPTPVPPLRGRPWRAGTRGRWFSGTNPESGGDLAVSGVPRTSWH